MSGLRHMSVYSLDKYRKTDHRGRSYSMVIKKQDALIKKQNKQLKTLYRTVKFLETDCNYLKVNNKDLARNLQEERKRSSLLLSKKYEDETTYHELLVKYVRTKEELEMWRKRMVFLDGILKDQAVINLVKLSDSITKLKVKTSEFLSENKQIGDECSQRNSSSFSDIRDTSQPRQAAVNPMIRGHLIQKPTVSLRRIDNSRMQIFGNLSIPSPIEEVEEPEKRIRQKSRFQYMMKKKVDNMRKICENGANTNNNNRMSINDNLAHRNYCSPNHSRLNWQSPNRSPLNRKSPNQSPLNRPSQNHSPLNWPSPNRESEFHPRIKNVMVPLVKIEVMQNSQPIQSEDLDEKSDESEIENNTRSYRNGRLGKNLVDKSPCIMLNRLNHECRYSDSNAEDDNNPLEGPSWLYSIKTPVTTTVEEAWDLMDDEYKVISPNHYGTGKQRPRKSNSVAPNNCTEQFVDTSEKQVFEPEDYHNINHSGNLNNSCADENSFVKKRRMSSLYVRDNISSILKNKIANSNGLCSKDVRTKVKGPFTNNFQMFDSNEAVFAELDENSGSTEDALKIQNSPMINPNKFVINDANVNPIFKGKKKFYASSLSKEEFDCNKSYVASQPENESETVDCNKEVIPETKPAAYNEISCPAITSSATFLEDNNSNEQETSMFHPDYSIIPSTVTERKNRSCKRTTKRSQKKVRRTDSSVSEDSDLEINKDLAGSIVSISDCSNQSVGEHSYHTSMKSSAKRGRPKKSKDNNNSIVKTSQLESVEENGSSIIPESDNKILDSTETRRPKRAVTKGKLYKEPNLYCKLRRGK